MLFKCLDFRGSKNTSSSKKHYPMVIEELCHQFSFEDIRKSTNNFDEKLVIGRSFGTVYKGCLKLNGATDYTIAIKRMPRYTYLDAKEDEFKKEIEVLCQLRHPNLVSLVGFCNHKENIIVYEYMPSGSLDDHLYNTAKEPLSWKKSLEICIGVARGLHYLHTGAKRSIFHRDIKPSSILLDNNMVPKLSSFGISLQGPLSMSKPNSITVDGISGTYGYIAPEYIQHGTITEKCDVFSFGMVILQMVCTKDNQMVINKANILADQYPGENEKKNLYFLGYLLMDVISFVKRFPLEEIIDPILNGKIASQCWQVFTDIMERCLKYEPDERPTMGEVEVLLEYALSLQEEADIRKTDGGYTLLSTTIMPSIFL